MKEHWEEALMDARAGLFSMIVCLVSVAARGEEPPAPKKGVWEFHRTIHSDAMPAPQVITRKECIDLAADLKKQRAKLEQMGCVFAPTKKSGNRFVTEATCKLPNGLSGKSRNTTVVTADGYESTIESEMTTGGTMTRSSEKLVAKRLGDCP